MKFTDDMYTSLHERMAEFEQYRDQLLANKRGVLFNLFHTETTMVEAIELATEELGSRLIEKATMHAKVAKRAGKGKDKRNGSGVSKPEVTEEDLAKAAALEAELMAEETAEENKAKKNEEKKKKKREKAARQQAEDKER